MKLRYRDRVTILNAPNSTGYGGQVIRNWDSPDVEVLPNVPAAVQPLSQFEETDRREMTITLWRMHCNVGLPITAESRVRWSGATGDLDVDGEVEVHAFQGRPHHVEATLRLVRDE